MRVTYCVKQKLVERKLQVTSKQINAAMHFNELIDQFVR